MISTASHCIREVKRHWNEEEKEKPFDGYNRILHTCGLSKSTVHEDNKAHAMFPEARVDLVQFVWRGNLVNILQRFVGVQEFKKLSARHVCGVLEPHRLGRRKPDLTHTRSSRAHSRGERD